MEGVSYSADRRAPRVPASLPIRILLNGDASEQGQSARTIDLSERGMRIRTKSALSEGQIIRIESWGDFGQPMPSRVVWVQVAPSGESQAGLEFLGVGSA